MLSVALASTIFAGCASNSTTGEDELAGESANDDAGKADGTGLYGYWTIASKGTGFTVARVNRSSAICGDDTTAPQCDVEALEWFAAGFGEADIAAFEQSIKDGKQLLLKGDIVGVDEGHPQITFDINQVWLAGSEDGVTEGVFVMAKDNGVRCLSAPCPSITETRLNTARSIDITAIDLDETGADEYTVAIARMQLSRDGVIIAGDRYYYGNDGKGRMANQFFTRAVPPQF
ncbi:MAG: DUF6748 domain-containing protein [Kofleriaceae bacterium]